MIIQRLVGLLVVIVLLIACGVVMFYLRRIFLVLAIEKKQQGKKELYKIFLSLSILSTCLLAFSVVGVTWLLTKIF